MKENAGVSNSERQISSKSYGRRLSFKYKKTDPENPKNPKKEMLTSGGNMSKFSQSKAFKSRSRAIVRNKADHHKSIKSKQKQENECDLYDDLKNGTNMDMSKLQLFTKNNLVESSVTLSSGVDSQDMVQPQKKLDLGGPNDDSSGTESYISEISEIGN